MATKKMFRISTDSGKHVEVEQMASFTREIAGTRFQFVVTKESGGVGHCVTHRLSGFKVCGVPYMAMLGASRITWKDAGEAALQTLLDRYGEQRVFDILSQAERCRYGLAADKPAGT